MDIDDLGYYDPMQDPPDVKIDAEKALAWLKDGAVPTDTARNLLSKAGVLQKLHEERHPRRDDAAQAVEEADTADKADTVEQPDADTEDKAETVEQPDTEQEAP